MSKTYVESANTLPIYDECDVLVVGGGSAGHAAAIAAARAGAEKVILMERYGYFGGDVTGGYVLMIPALSWHEFLTVRGLQEEWFVRMDKNCPDYYLAPARDELGEKTANKIQLWSTIHGCVHPGAEPYLIRAPYYEPNYLKLEMDAMVQEEPNIKIMIHCWGTKPIMEDNVCKGVIYESKEGRKAVMAKVVIDATGDGDIFRQSGAPYHTDLSGGRAGMTALVWRMGGIDFDAYARWRIANPEEAAAFQKDLVAVAGYPTSFFPAGVNDVVWFNNWLPNLNCANIEDIRYSEFLVRNSIHKIINFCKKNIPFAARNAYLYDIAPQLGSRTSVRLDGEHSMSRLDIATAKQFDDVVLWHSLVPAANDGAPVEIPYGVMLPKKVENLLCPGRHCSADADCISGITLIPQCVGMGQACGVAAAVCVKDGTTTHNVDIKKVQYILSHEQDVPLPRQDNTDPELVKALEEYKYGTLAPQAKKIREAAGLDW